MSDTATPAATDTPLPVPATRLERIKGFIGDLARPFAIIVTSAGASVASVITATRVENGNDGAMLLGAIFAGLGALYIGKAWEVAKSGKHSAEVEIAKANSPPSL